MDLYSELAAESRKLASRVATLESEIEFAIKFIRYAWGDESETSAAIIKRLHAVLTKDEP